MESRTTLNDLKVAREELIAHEIELEKCSADLQKTKDQLHSSELEEQKMLHDAHNSLEEMMFAISHKIRKSVANILGISKLICEEEDIKNEDLRAYLTIIIHAAESLNKSTEELSRYICAQKNNLKIICEE